MYQSTSTVGCRANETEFELDLSLLFRSTYISNKAMRSYLCQIVIKVLTCDRRIGNKLKQLPHSHHCNIVLLEKAYQKSRAETRDLK